ncbi:GNAT family N-acetyltransferase [Aquibacillus halophilus]|uniref:GNAT family N-acetyltransferase n=1 Tax=Aquibacillus halophilus TaxID=930132 RepID=A0A6A8DTP4_9BACI|nr:GNAT family N-acetyltransferase [Aquibacillus halophilus]MRH44602.1 GNAT family N-acetyltransferase [Aquibacillus halophilus]
MEKILITNRLSFRKMHEGDVGFLLRIFSDPIAMKYYPSVKNKEETVRWINWTLDNYRKFGVGLFIVEDRITGDFLGQCGLVPQKIDGEVKMEIGYLFVRDHWGNGYATEAAKACKHYGLEKLKVPTLVSLIDPLNVASIKVSEKIGMERKSTVQRKGKLLWVYGLDA